MTVLVDTPVWSLALRRKHVPADTRDEQVIRNDGRVQMIGPIRQELLSRIREQERFRQLRDHLRAFDEPRLQVQDYEYAAEMSNYYQARGIAGSATDFLICGVAHRTGGKSSPRIAILRATLRCFQLSFALLNNRRHDLSNSER